ncbi:hypothetical protein BDV11DRAFT_170592 [Aspergillus similis]
MQFTLFTTSLYLSLGTLVSASTPLPTSTMDASFSIPSSLTNAFAHPLTCPQLSTMNSKLDELVHYAFPATIPTEEAYAVALFTHAYKVLVNTMHGTHCAFITEDDMEFNMTMFESSMNSKVVKRQGAGSTVTDILCVIIDTILGDNGGEAIPTSSGGGGASSAGGARIPSATATTPQNSAEETGRRMRAIKRQDNGGDEGIVEDLLKLVGSILQIILGCNSGDNS